jgi:hypothetical protein
VPLVTDAEVKTILSTEIDTSAFILSADALINDVLGTAGYSADLLKQIELYLSAHLACLMDPREKQVHAGASVTFEGETGLGLNWSRYGQVVKLFDKKGILASLGKMQAKIRVASRTELDPEGNPV